MANKILWSARSAASHIILGADVAPTLKNLSNGAQKLGAAFDNSAVGARWRFMDVELYFRLVTGTTALYIDLYLIPAINGTNYVDGDDSVAPSGNFRVGTFQCKSVATQQRGGIYGIPIPPVPFKLLIKNSSGYALTNTDAENTLDAYFYSEELQ